MAKNPSSPIWQGMEQPDNANRDLHDALQAAREAGDFDEVERLLMVLRIQEREEPPLV